MKKAIARLVGPVAILAALAQSVFAAEGGTADDKPVTLEIAGLSATTGEDEPRILFILPWQPPGLPRRPRVELDDRAPELEQALDPMVVERHRKFRNTLDPMTLVPQGIEP